MKDKITKELINDIFTLKKKLKGNEKKQLSKYQEIIPLYDIYSHLIYPIFFYQIENYILNKHYRFLTEPQKQIFINYLKKLKEKNILTDSEKEFKEKIEYNLKIIENYDLDILEETNIKAFYYGSSNLGQSISICRRKSFHPSLTHLSPYYSLNELIKMGQNMEMIKKQITPIELQNEELHYKICTEISKNDIYANEILNHQNYLKDYENEIRFFSIYGSHFVNQNLRFYQNEGTFNKCPYPQFLEYTEYLNEIFKKSPGLDNEYFVYRFIQNDDFLKSIKKGEIFSEAGIMSATRNPFYSPNELEKFGIILLKITVPREFDKLLLIESLSVFPNEQEIIFPPGTKLKLISTDSEFNYYHTNKTIEKQISKRYHFKIVGQDKFNNIPKFIEKNVPIISLESKLFSIEFSERKIEFIRTLTNNQGFCDFRLKNKTIRFIAMTFDSSKAYKHIYSQKDKDGLLLYCFENNSMKYAIEISYDLVFNYQNKFFPDNLDLNENEIYELLGIIGYLFGYENAKVFFKYKKENNLIYPQIFDTFEEFKLVKFKEGFSDREFNSKLNKQITLDSHPKFNEKLNNWKDFFRFSKNKNTLEDFYSLWNEKFNDNILENLYTLVDLNYFYDNNNLQIDKVIMNKTISDFNRFRQTIN